MRILAISAFYPPDTVGGYEWAAFEVISRLRERGHEIRVLAGEPDNACPADEAVIRRLRRVQVTDLSQPCGSRYQALKAYCYNYQTTMRVVEALKPDLLYVWCCANLTPAVVAAVRDTRLPPVFHLEDTWLLGTRGQSHGSGISGMISRMVKYMFAARPCFTVGNWTGIFVSASLQRQYTQAGMSFAASAVVHNGVEAAACPRAWPERAPDRLRLGYAGRIRENKGLGILLEALRLRHAAGRDDFILDVFADLSGSFAERLRHGPDAAALGERVNWRGALPRNRMLEAYQRLDLLVVPSVWEEPFGLVAIEALAAGVPVLAADRGGLPEIVDDACGWLCEPRAEAMRATLDLALSDYTVLARKGRTGYDVARRRFAWKDKVDKIETMLKDCSNVHHDDNTGDCARGKGRRAG